jgi:hypothetical protein
MPVKKQYVHRPIPPRFSPQTPECIGPSNPETEGARTVCFMESATCLEDLPRCVNFRIQSP